jgi:protein SCO1/2
MKTALLYAIAMACASESLAVNPPSTAPSAPLATPSPPCCREGLPPGKFSEKSVYSLDSVWTSDVGRQVKLDVLRAHPQVVALFFTNCQHSCPYIVTDMQAIEKALPRGLRAKVDFLLVSIDPTRDTPDVLRAYREKKHLGTDHWTLLTGSPESVKQLADMIGFQYYPGSQRQYAHTLVITILNDRGEIVFQQAGIGASPDGAVATLAKLTKKGATAKQ